MTRNPLKHLGKAIALLGSALAFTYASVRAAFEGDARLAILFSFLAVVLGLMGLATVADRFFRWRLPFSIRITAQGWCFIITTFGFALAAVNTGNNLLLLVVATFLSAIIVSGVFARLSLKGISLSLQIPENVFERESVAIKLSLTNTKRFFPTFSVVVEDVEIRSSVAQGSSPRRFLFWKGRAPAQTMPDPMLRHSAYFPILRPLETRSELVIQAFPRRGPYRLDGFRVSTRFPFGLFNRRERIRASGEIIVYPSIREVSSFFHLLPFLPGHLEGVHAGHGESLYAIRRYQEGESARLVDWKATAKTGVLMAREYARDEESKFCMILDARLHSGQPSATAEAFERAVSLVASLAFHFCEEGAELELIHQHDYVPRGAGLDHLYELLRSLALIRCEETGSDQGTELGQEFSERVDKARLEEVLSDKVFKIIITSRPRGRFPSIVWRSSHVIYFDQL